MFTISFCFFPFTAKTFHLVSDPLLLSSSDFSFEMKQFVQCFVLHDLTLVVASVLFFSFYEAPQQLYLFYPSVEPRFGCLYFPREFNSLILMSIYDIRHSLSDKLSPTSSAESFSSILNSCVNDKSPDSAASFNSSFVFANITLQGGH